MNVPSVFFVKSCIPQKFVFRARYNAQSARMTQPIGQVNAQTTTHNAAIQVVSAGSNNHRLVATTTSPVIAVATTIIVPVNLGFSVANFVTLSISFVITSNIGINTGCIAAQIAWYACVVSAFNLACAQAYESANLVASQT